MIDMQVMNWRICFFGVIFAAIVVVGCNDDDDGLSAKDIPTQVLVAFEAKYPDTSVKWERDRGMLKAEFWNNGNEAEAWFERNGVWVRTETDYNVALPALVQEFLAVNYAGYAVDDADSVELPEDAYFEIELEQLAHPDVRLLIREDGTLVK